MTNVTSNLKILLSAISVAALLASPAAAKSQVRHHHGHAATVFVPSDAYGSAVGPRYAPSPSSPGYNWDRDHDPRDNPS